MLLGIITFLSFCSVTIGHGYLNYPVTRNAVGSITNGYCNWVGPIVCTGCPHCWNQDEPTTGCGIVQGGGAPFVYGDGGLGFSHTGIKTIFTAGEIVDMEVIITAYHGGRFEYRIQDAGNSPDPIGSLWDSMELLTVESFSPLCDNPEFCGAEPCTEEKTCAQIPLRPYGTHDGNYIIKVKIPEELSCNHCVLQWRWITANSCDGTKISCDRSEKFWNCADIQIINSNTDDYYSSDKNTTIIPTTVPTASFSDTTLFPSIVPTIKNDTPEICFSISPIVSDIWCYVVHTNDKYQYIEDSSIFESLCSCSVNP